MFIKGVVEPCHLQKYLPIQNDFRGLICFSGAITLDVWIYILRDRTRTPISFGGRSTPINSTTFHHTTVIMHLPVRLDMSTFCRVLTTLQSCFFLSRRSTAANLWTFEKSSFVWFYCVSNAIGKVTSSLQNRCIFFSWLLMSFVWNGIINRSVPWQNVHRIPFVCHGMGQTYHENRHRSDTLQIHFVRS